MTEEEAKTKWCPMFGNSSPNGRGASSNNRMSFNDQTFTNDCTCITSNCMLWRYVDYEYVIPDSVPPSGRDTLEGYCGLANNPPQQD